MKNNFFVIVTLFFGLFSYAQVGINIDQPQATLDVSDPNTNPNLAVGMIAPRVTGNELKAKDTAYGNDQAGSFVYVSEKVATMSVKTAAITAPGYYYFDGSVWVGLKAGSQSMTDASRFLGGTVYVRFNSLQNSTNNYLPNSQIIGGAPGQRYNVGTVQTTSSKGGIDSAKGTGYKISNPSDGVFDIMFDTPLTEIYGISTNIVDAYGQSGGGINTGDYPDSRFPGTRLKTNDNTQVAFLSNSVIRIKTGDQFGKSSNRPFTFIVSGR
ncbi:hypothetical protein QWZ06_15815 [Chryseobacterium tructae]|uniref:Uncharacterized protein n=1 Tax=Chryseobacterium tructae TaxID=1037380 RepID=A0ABV7Y156_9FLAO|nr:hypothetical protein [Chryseobacterium tructae]MDN3693652.1 hypothetical protein [Chryseobacterium tructae]